MRKLIIRLDPLLVLGSLLSLLLAALTLSGHLQQWVRFVGPENEILFFLLTYLLSVVLLIMGVEVERTKPKP